MILFQEEYLCKCNEEFDPVKAQVEFYRSLLKEARLEHERTNLNDDQVKPFPFDFLSVQKFAQARYRH